VDRDRAVAGWSACSGSVSQSVKACQPLTRRSTPVFRLCLLRGWAMFARGRGAQQGRGSQRRRQLYECGAPVLPRCRGARAKSLLCNSRLTPARPGA
jgi:hypothetical protein